MQTKAHIHQYMRSNIFDKNIPVVHYASTVLHRNRQTKLAGDWRSTALPRDDRLKVFVASGIRTINLFDKIYIPTRRNVQTVL